MIDNNDIKKLKTIFATKEDLNELKTQFATKSELMEGLRHLENKIELSNEKFHSKIFDLVDGLAKEIHEGRESRAIFSYRIEDHENRIKTLES